ncbi:MAG TPA: crossover junction endodeoxyribonuclease RuvC [Anaeromyxobacteraceae bacterium]|nr:crossover junction endodeoxyribonuclease RuvC [Anaeromyxobacteraceae bacterium]
MVVLGIDPGSRRCGYGVVERTGARFRHVVSGVVEPGDLSVAERLAVIFDRLSELLLRERVDAVAVEAVFCGRSARSALALGQARGVALAAAARAGLPVFEYAPAEVKSAFAGHGRAEKAQIIRMMRMLFGREARLADEADALAIAVCCLARRLGTKPAPAKSRGAGLAARRSLRPSIRRFGGSP